MPEYDSVRCDTVCVSGGAALGWAGSKLLEMQGGREEFRQKKQNKSNKSIGLI